MEGRGTGKKEGISGSIAEHTEKTEPIFLPEDQTHLLLQKYISRIAQAILEAMVPVIVLIVNLT